MDRDIRGYLTPFLDRERLLEHESKVMLSRMGLAVPKGIFLPRGRKIPGRLRLRFPLVAKVSSRVISAKSEVGGVRMPLLGIREMRTAVQELMGIAGADGVLLEELAPRGVEVIVGGLQDREFGPVVMFGIGGISVEVYRDVAFSLVPLSRGDAAWLPDQLQARALLGAFRGRKPVDRKALTAVLLAASRIMETGLVREINLNPVILSPDGACIADAKVSLSTSGTPSRA